jgi:hypothetical protein
LTARDWRLKSAQAVAWSSQRQFPVAHLMMMDIALFIGERCAPPSQQLGLIAVLPPP